MLGIWIIKFFKVFLKIDIIIKDFWKYFIRKECNLNMFYFVYMDLSVSVFVFYNENSECVFYDLVVILNIRCFMLYM